MGKKASTGRNPTTGTEDVTTKLMPMPRITGLGSSGATIAKDGGISDSEIAAAEAAAARAMGGGDSLGRRAGPGVSRVAAVAP